MSLAVTLLGGGRTVGWCVVGRCVGGVSNFCISVEIIVKELVVYLIGEVCVSNISYLAS